MFTCSRAWENHRKMCRNTLDSGSNLPFQNVGHHFIHGLLQVPDLGRRYSLRSACSARKQKVISFYYLAHCAIYRLFPGLPPPWMCSNGSECFGREHTDCCLAHTIQWELFLLSAKTTAWKYVQLRHFAVWKCSRNWFHGCKSRIIMSS